MDYQAQIDKWKAFDAEKARNIFNIKSGSQNLTWRFQKPNAESVDLIDINKYYDHYNIQTPLIQVSFLKDTKLIGKGDDAVLDKTWEDLNQGNANNFIKSLTIEDSGFKTMRLQLIDRTFQTVPLLLQRAINKGSGNVIEENYNNNKIEKEEKELQEGEIVSLDVLRQPNGVTNNIRVNYGWAVGEGEARGYFQRLQNAGIRYGNTETNYRWNSRTYANYDPLVRNDGVASTLAAEEDSNTEKFSFNLSSQKVLSEYNLQTTAWNGWEEFYITDVKSTLTETGILYEITATGSDNMKLNGYKFVQMYAQITAKPKELLTCLMNNFNGPREEAYKKNRPFYLLWVDKDYPEIQEEKRTLLMRNGKPYDPSQIEDKLEKEQADKEAQYGSMSQEDMENYANDTKIRLANINKRVTALQKALGCLTGKSGGNGDESYDKGNVKAVTDKFVGLNKDNIKLEVGTSDNIHKDNAAYYYMAALTNGIIPNDISSFYQRTCFFKYLERNLKNFNDSDAQLNNLKDENYQILGTSGRKVWKMSNIYKALPVAFHDDIFDPETYNSMEKELNGKFGQQITMSQMSEAMMTVLDDYVSMLKSSKGTITIFTEVADGNENKTETPAFILPLNLALLLCPTRKSRKYYTKDKETNKLKYTTIENLSARQEIVAFYDAMVQWITGYKSKSKGISFNGLYNDEINGGNNANAIFDKGMENIASYVLNNESEEAIDKKIDELKKKVQSKYEEVFDDGKSFGGLINGKKEEVALFALGLCMMSLASQLNNGTISGFQDGADRKLDDGTIIPNQMKRDHLASLERFKGLKDKLFKVSEDNPKVVCKGLDIYDINLGSYQEDSWDDYGNQIVENKRMERGGDYSSSDINTAFIPAYKSRCEFCGNYGAYSSDSSDDWSADSLIDQLKKTWNFFKGASNGKPLELDFQEADDFPNKNKNGANRSYGSGTRVQYYKAIPDQTSIQKESSEGYFQRIFQANFESSNDKIKDKREKLAIQITKDIKTLTKTVTNLTKTIATLEAGKLQNQITLTLGGVDSVGKVKYKSISSLLNEFCAQCKPYHDYDSEVRNKNKQKNATSAKDAEVETQAKYVDAEGNEQVADMEAEAPTYPLSWDVVGYLNGKPLVGLFYKKPFRFSKIRRYCWGTGNKDATAVKALSISSASEFAMLSSAQRTTVKVDDAGRMVGLLKKGYGEPGTEEESSSIMETFINAKDLANQGLITRNTATEDDLKKLSTVMLQAVNRGSITVLGDPSLRFSGVVSPYTLPIYIDVSLQKEGQIWGRSEDLGMKSTLSGIYVVGKITHNINSSGYTTTMEVMRYPGITKTVLGS